MRTIARAGLVTRIKQRLIDNWVDQTASKMYDFSPWRNKSFWGVINNTLETNETIFSAVTSCLIQWLAYQLRCMKIIK